MSKTARTVAFGHLGLPLVILCFVAFPSMLFAGGKEHPMQGTVTARDESGHNGWRGDSRVYARTSDLHRKNGHPSLCAGVSL